MLTTRSGDAAPALPAVKTRRREFLARLSLVASGGMASSECSSGALAAAQKTTPRRRNAAATGIEAIREVLASKEPLTWVFTGDSITHGALHTRGWRSYPEHFAERVRWELRRMRDIVVNTGVSGDRTQGLLPDIDWRALHLKPAVVSVMLGMNDCTQGTVGRELFRKELTAIVSKIASAGAVPILNSPNTVYAKNAPMHGDLTAYAQIVRDVSLGTNSLLVDHFSHWEKARPDQESLLKWLDDGSIHPNVYGHREIARLIFRELGIFDDKSPTCQLEVP